MPSAVSVETQCLRTEHRFEAVPSEGWGGDCDGLGAFLIMLEDIFSFASYILILIS